MKQIHRFKIYEKITMQSGTMWFKGRSLAIRSINDSLHLVPDDYWCHISYIFTGIALINGPSYYIVIYIFIISSNRTEWKLAHQGYEECTIVQKMIAKVNYFFQLCREKCVSLYSLWMVIWIVISLRCYSKSTFLLIISQTIFMASDRAILRTNRLPDELTCRLLTFSGLSEIYPASCWTDPPRQDCSLTAFDLKYPQKRNKVQHVPLKIIIKTPTNWRREITYTWC